MSIKAHWNILYQLFKKIIESIWGKLDVMIGRIPNPVEISHERVNKNFKYQEREFYSIFLMSK